MKSLSVAILWLCSVAVFAAEPVVVNMAGQADAKHVGEDKWTLVMVWSTACHVCQKETPAISAYSERHADSRIRVLGVAINGYQRKAAIEDFGKEFGMKFPTLIAEPAQFLAHYKAQTGQPLSGTPTFLLDDRAGKLSVVNPGPVDLSRLETFLDQQDG